MVSEAAWLQSEVLGQSPIVARSLEGTDELNRSYAFRVHLELPIASLAPDDLEALLDKPASLAFRQEDVTLNRFNAVVVDVAAQSDVEHDKTDLFLELRPVSWLLSMRKGSEIFLSRTIPQIIEEKLTSAGLGSGRDFVLSLRDSYARREFTAQHDETDLAFVMRLAEEAGIATFFEERDDHDAWIFTDTSASYRPGPRPQLRVRTRAEHPAAFDVRRHLRRVPAEVVTHDYNYRTPMLALKSDEAIAKAAARGTWVEFGHDPKTETEVRELAQIRSEEWAARHHVVEGSSTDSSLRAGRVLDIVDAGGNETRVLVTRVDYAFRKGGDRGDVGWVNRFSAIPYEVRFRPQRVTPVPRISGLVHGVVDGAVRGEYAELDEQGRYFLRMAYDRSGRTDLGATHPVRMMQPHAGAQYGMHFPLRPGADVLVGFVNGDPDRPIIVGTAPNPVTVSPVSLQNQTQNVLRSGSRNELVMEDLRGSERVRVHSPKEDSTLQIGAPEEAETGILLKTEAHVSAASRLSNNTLTDRHTVLAQTSTAIAGKSAVMMAGLGAVSSAAERGMSDVNALDSAALDRELARIEAKPPREEPEEEATTDETSVGSTHFSEVAEKASSRADQAALNLVREVARTVDTGLDDAQGRTQGAALGEPLAPAAVVASERTAAVVGRDVAVVFGDRAAALGSADTASVVGLRTAQLKSEGEVEVAAGKTFNLTTAGDFDIAVGDTARIVVGYYPEEAPPLAADVSLGIMSKKDLRIHAIEDCVLVCAKKNIIGTAHTGDIRLKAEKTIALTGGSIVGSAGTVLIDAHTIKVKARGDIKIEAGGKIDVIANAVNVTAPTIKLDGNVEITKNLTVGGESDL
ncbi:MAG: type VI secretion system tip protein VgrG [Polyangiaceae bacterium]|nr:type VI secretion system tip protein VgrG [Polyangiaceae bacterium]